MRRIRAVVRGTAAALLLVLVAACAPLPSGGGQAVGPSGPADPNAVFGWAHIVGLSRFDPHRATSSYDNTFLFLTYDRLVHVEAVSAEIAVTQPREIALYLRAFSALADAAVYGPAARALITSELNRLTADD